MGQRNQTAGDRESGASGARALAGEKGKEDQEGTRGLGVTSRRAQPDEKAAFEDQAVEGGTSTPGLWGLHGVSG